LSCLVICMTLPCSSRGVLCPACPGGHGSYPWVTRQAYEQHRSRVARVFATTFPGLLWDGQQVTLLAGYADHRPAFQAVESLGFCPRRSAARKCRGQRQSGDRSRPWTGKADRSTCDFPSFRLKREHYCRRRVDSRVGSTAEKTPAAQPVAPTALA
jgi:hypothetical protein